MKTAMISRPVPATGSGYISDSSMLGCNRATVPGVVQNTLGKTRTRSHNPRGGWWKAHSREEYKRRCMRGVVYSSRIKFVGPQVLSTFLETCTWSRLCGRYPTYLLLVHDAAADAGYDDDDDNTTTVLWRSWVVTVLPIFCRLLWPFWHVTFGWWSLVIFRPTQTYTNSLIWPKTGIFDRRTRHFGQQKGVAYTWFESNN